MIYIPLKQIKKYDLSICQAGLRHMNRPMEVLRKMTEAVKKSGLVVSIDINRELIEHRLRNILKCMIKLPSILRIKKVENRF